MLRLARSPTLLPGPTFTVFLSPRTTALYHTDAPSCNSTSPTTVADGATKASGATLPYVPSSGMTGRCLSTFAVVVGAEENRAAEVVATAEEEGAAAPAPPTARVLVVRRSTRPAVASIFIKTPAAALLSTLYRFLACVWLLLPNKKKPK